MAKNTSVKVTPNVDFTGYPDGVTEKKFVAGTAYEVTAEYAALLRAKGLVDVEAMTNAADK